MLRQAASFAFQHEAALKWSLLLLAFAALAVWETFRPRRVLTASTARRWAVHGALSFLCNTSALWIYRASAVMVAAASADSRYGVLNRPIAPYWLRFIAAILLLDLLRYAQHYAYHAFPLLWRIHQVHHADPDFDWSTGLRFHPAEVLLNQGSYLAVIAVLAPPTAAVLAIELVEIVENLFVHANVSLPGRLDSLLRRFLITPDLHRIHHSDDPAEQNTNFGAIFPWWDRLFGTYIGEPAAGQDKIVFGLRAMPIQRGTNLLSQLTLPFRAIRQL